LRLCLRLGLGGLGGLGGAMLGLRLGLPCLCSPTAGAHRCCRLLANLRRRQLHLRRWGQAARLAKVLRQKRLRLCMQLRLLSGRWLAPPSGTAQAQLPRLHAKAGQESWSRRTTTLQLRCHDLKPGGLRGVRLGCLSHVQDRCLHDRRVESRLRGHSRLAIGGSGTSGHRSGPVRKLPRAEVL
jgi:hypothetical protein